MTDDTTKPLEERMTINQPYGISGTLELLTDGFHMQVFIGGMLLVFILDEDYKALNRHIFPGKSVPIVQTTWAWLDETGEARYD